MFLRNIVAPAATALSLAFAAPAIAQDDQATPELLPDIVLGSEDAPLTMIEYASFTCGHCATFHNDVFPQLKAEFIDTGQLRFIQRDVYFDQVGLWAGVLARCGGDDRYYAISHLLFEDQAQWLQGGSGDEIAAGLRRVGLKAGLTEDQMTACWEDTDRVEQLVATFQANAAADGVEATPSFIIGDQKVPNQSWENLRGIIQSKLDEVTAE